MVLRVFKSSKNILKKITYMEGRELYENQGAAKNLIWIGLSRGSLTEATKRLD
jgi:hypothetical protein